MLLPGLRLLLGTLWRRLMLLVAAALVKAGIATALVIVATPVATVLRLLIAHSRRRWLWGLLRLSGLRRLRGLIRLSGTLGLLNALLTSLFRDTRLHRRLRILYPGLVWYAVLIRTA